MKTAEDLVNYLHDQFPATVGHTELYRLVKSVELENFKAGMTEAARICKKCITEDCTCERCGQTSFLSKTIITARDAKEKL